MGKKQKIVLIAFLYNDNNEVLLARRAETKKLLPGILELPGGHIEYGETVEQGLKREIKEEMGIDIEIGDPIFAFTYMDHKNCHTLELVILAEQKDKNQEIKLDPTEHSEYLWADKEKALKILDKDNPDEKMAAEKGFNRILA